jgi:hypothetical protein
MGNFTNFTWLCLMNFLIKFNVKKKLTHTKDLLDKIKSKNILSKAIHIKNIIRNKYFLFLKINHIN